ncbi:Gluconate transporter family protein [Pseudonocardia sp. Ae406_Ps2]|uniref:GntT/GntP/DsdX family permease n=1 Tax=unclassified Pseudonocardia TaxID=2619320 RepID=UPI00094AEB80|nr:MULTISPECIES: SLC13 family permease [unclassified Pseudonocardia]OLL99626.1 Gluconate transporter family protein [Pseudonocardia sp. Ae331_Ps2]OLM02627.1 Gluconate transporter family protein [Pseudonocardia sp. Ae406_Ps2]OLM24202.1 Gluconate transporter family protein [Pseudonocardia sp. Ae706_Ps2]
MTLHPALVLAAEQAQPVASAGRLVTAALVGIVALVLLITQFSLHPFLALTIGSLLVAAVAGMSMGDAVAAFSDGFGSTAASVGTLIALGAMFGKLLADSGGADRLVDTIVSRSGPRTLPWSMAAVGALIGLPMFFEIGLVILMPVIFLVARRAQVSLIAVGIPALAGLSAMHGLVPPHPGPLAAIGILDADLGITLVLGVLVSIPVVVLAGPLFATLAARWVDVSPPALFESPVAAGSTTASAASAGSAGTGAGADAGPGSGADSDAGADSGAGRDVPDGGPTRRPGFAATLFTVLLPVVLMMSKAVGDIAAPEGNPVRAALDFVGTPLVALLLSVLVAMVTLGTGSGMNRAGIMGSLERSLPAIAGIVLIVAAGGGFKQTLVDTGIGAMIAGWATGAGISALLLGWLVAVAIRLATGSATVATVTAAGILVPLLPTLDPTQTSLLVLAIGAGSLFFSHVNDAGFWLVKEYFGLTVGQNIKTWSIMETVISVSGLVLVLLIDLVI